MDWARKIHAFLHDPPNKPLALASDHAGQGQELASTISGAALDETSRRIIETADHLAAGADRQNWLKPFHIDPRQELQLIHPLEGKPVLVAGTVTEAALELAFSPECVDAAQQAGQKLSEVLAEIRDLRLRFLLLWRFLPELLREVEGQRTRLGVLWPLLPADSRMPEHPVLVHASLVAALASIHASGQSAALLRVQFAPVQEFIEASRKLRDLWASSSILAETTWKAVEPVVERFGPDHVLFPSLRYEPRFDRWLLQQLQDEPCSACSEKEAGHKALWRVVQEAKQHLGRNLRTPSLPNLFTAIVPADEAKRLAQDIEQQLRKFWIEEIKQAAAKAGEGEAFVARAEQQAKALLQVFWSVVPWPLNVAPGTWVHTSCWHTKPESASTHRALATLNNLGNVFAGYKPNAGLLYADLNNQASVLVDATKRERLRFPHDEEGLKCSLCGERQVLGPGDFWSQRTEGFRKRKDTDTLDTNEQLCGPCTWKRRFAPEGLSEEDGVLGRRHPSTGEIAAAAFKLAVIRASKHHETLRKAVKEFTEAAREDQRQGKLPEGDLRIFTPQVVHEEAQDEEVLEEFANIDGQWLLPFPREESSEVRAEATRQAAKNLRKVAAKKKISPPRPYFAVVDFDGDEMGKWLSGTHPEFPRVGETLHTRVLQEIRDQHPQLDSALRERRFLTPAFHASISAAAATFARFGAPMTLEGEQLPGHLIYAGGDDALFVAPVPQALELALRLRLRFSGWPKPFQKSLLDNREAIDTLQQELEDFLQRPRPWVAARLGQRGRPTPAEQVEDADRLGLAFGTRVTASVGMCVAHFRWPLGAVLREARRSLEEAKHSGRNALAITVQRRSGSISRAVLPFFVRNEDGKAEFPVLALFRLVNALGQEREVSTRLATAFRAEIESLHIGPRAGRQATGGAGSTLWEIGKALARRVVRRRALDGKDNELADIIEDAVIELGRGIRIAHEDDATALYRWAEALTVAAFLARPGDRE